METTENVNLSGILTPTELWDKFDDALPLKESKIDETTIDGVVYSHVYFYGRETSQGRVRIYGVFAKLRTADKKPPKAGLLIIPDIGKPIDFNLIEIYVRQGYAVLMINYSGEAEGLEYFTKYPECISYANYLTAGRALDHADEGAGKTSWYEWTAVARYGVSFLKNQYGFDNIGVLGVKNGADIGWQLCGTDKRVSCFVALFGAGWRTYKGIYKFSGGDKDIKIDDERLKYLAAVDAQSYAQHVTCPVFFMTASNSVEFDCDRAMDTITRVKAVDSLAINIVPRYNYTLDANSKRNIDIFFAKYLLGFRAVMPKLPKIKLDCDNKNVTVEVEIDYSDQLRVKNFNVYFAEDCENPAYRDWVAMTVRKSKIENQKIFDGTMVGNSRFVNAFAVVEYKNGITVTSVVAFKKINKIDSRKLNLLYSSAEKTSSFIAPTNQSDALGGVFFLDPKVVEYAEGNDKISGVTSKYGLISYKFNYRTFELNERSLLVFDVDIKENTTLTVVVSVEEDKGVVDYKYVVSLKGGEIWQHIMIKLSDFKSEIRRSINNYSCVSCVRFESVAQCVFNNILVV